MVEIDPMADLLFNWFEDLHYWDVAGKESELCFNLSG